MNILAIDTTTSSASVSLKKEEKIINKSIENKITHSEKLLPLIDSCLKESNTTLDNIDLFACLNGPGSFTGIRIGLSTLKAFTIFNNKDIFSISSLDLMAYALYKKIGSNKQKYIASLIDARNDRVYYGIFKIQLDENNKIHIIGCVDPGNDLLDNTLKYIDEFIKENNISKNDFLIAGNLTKELENFTYIYPQTNDILSAIDNIADTQNYMYNSFTLDATYIRPSQAERIKNEKD